MSEMHLFFSLSSWAAGYSNDRSFLLAALAVMGGVFVSVGAIATFLIGRRYLKLEVLVLEPAPEQNVTNHDLASIVSGSDSDVGENLKFRLSAAGAKKMRSLTRQYIGQQMGIVIDGQLNSAPIINATISSSGVITGDFTKAEVEDIVRRWQNKKTTTKLDASHGADRSAPAADFGDHSNDHSDHD